MIECCKQGSGCTFENEVVSSLALDQILMLNGVDRAPPCALKPGNPAFFGQIPPTIALYRNLISLCRLVQARGRNQVGFHNIMSEFSNDSTVRHA